MNSPKNKVINNIKFYHVFELMVNHYCWWLMFTKVKTVFMFMILYRVPDFCALGPVITANHTWLVNSSLPAMYAVRALVDCTTFYFRQKPVQRSTVYLLIGLNIRITYTSKSITTSFLIMIHVIVIISPETHQPVLYHRGWRAAQLTYHGPESSHCEEVFKNKHQ